MKFLRLLLFLVGVFSLGALGLLADEQRLENHTILRELNDGAGLFGPDAHERVQVRLEQFYTAGAPRGTAHRPNDFQLRVYTLASAGRSAPGKFIEDLYRTWRKSVKDSGDYFERQVILFVFVAEHEARIVPGREIPPEALAAVKGIEPDLPSLFTGEPEQALLAVVDKLAELDGIPATYHEPPPVPADPGGPIFGETSRIRIDRDALARVIGDASQKAGHPIVLVLDPELNHVTPRQRAEGMAAAWPGRTLLVLATYPTDSNELVVVLRPADQVKARFPDKEVDRIEREILEASKGDELDRTLTRNLGEIGAISAGQPSAGWSPWRHPIQALLGGRDASPDARFGAAVRTLFMLAVLILVLWWIWFFIHDPREATAGLIAFILNIVFEGISGGGGGGGGGGSSGFSGGGGDSGGGGASGSW